MNDDVTGPRSALSRTSHAQWPERLGPLEPAHPHSLPVVGQAVVRERVDAVRNRRKLLEAADRLYSEHGVDEISMDDVAAAAGVGKGTLYRRFADKSALVAALLDERETALQAAMISGPPPLGPGAAPTERLAAFAVAYLEYVGSNIELVALSQTASPGARLRTGAHQFWRQHCTYLLTAAGAPDANLRADALLSALAAEQVRQWLQDRAEAELAPALERLAVALASR